MKTQAVRVADVVFIGPLMVWGGLQLRGRYPAAGGALALLGGLTSLYNLRNYQRQEAMEREHA